ncbi:MAG: DUF4158 domain-containing protein [Pseudonocardiales bacterium]|nr:DUF4158 domain-containing protein [Pseudonocardiales bacterium]
MAGRVGFTTGDGPHALFAAAVGYLRAHRVVLPGVSTLARLVAKVREDATARLHRMLCQELTAGQRARLDELLVVPEGARVCELERWRKGVSVPSGKNLEKALKRAGEITGSGLPALVASAGGAPASAAGFGPRRHGRQGHRAAPSPAGQALGHHRGHRGLPAGQSHRRRPGTAGPAHGHRTARQGRTGQRQADTAQPSTAGAGLGEVGLGT